MNIKTLALLKMLGKVDKPLMLKITTPIAKKINTLGIAKPIKTTKRQIGNIDFTKPVQNLDIYGGNTQLQDIEKFLYNRMPDTPADLLKRQKQRQQEYDNMVKLQALKLLPYARGVVYPTTGLTGLYMNELLNDGGNQ